MRQAARLHRMVEVSSMTERRDPQIAKGYHLVTYRLDGDEHSCIVWAENLQEAERHLAAIRDTGQIGGSVVGG